MAQPPTANDRHAKGPTPRRRLDAWKEIAAYLKRDVTTVRRWEKLEGLPVHRHLHGKLGSVFAYADEIDQWSRQRSLLAPSDRPESSTAAGDAEDRPKPDAAVEPAFSRFGKLGLAAVTSTAIIAVASSTVWRPQARPHPDGAGASRHCHS